MNTLATLVAPSTDGPLEIEIKLAATPDQLEALRLHPALGAHGGRARHCSTYFDTPDGALAKAGASLRLRHRDGACEQTLKLASKRKSQIQRCEWNHPLPADATAPDIAAFPPMAAQAVARLAGDAPLLPYAKVAVERETRLITHGASQIELAFDRGEIAVPGGASVPVAELELELRDGQLADALALALTLPLGPDLGWSIATKAHRAQALAKGHAPSPTQAAPAQATPAQAAPAQLAPAMPAARGFQAIGWACLGQWLGHAPLVAASGDPGALHQARVAVRRLRAAMALFARGLFAQDRIAKSLRDDLRQAAQALGPARDLFVLRRRLAAHPGMADGVGRALLRALAKAEAEATSAAQAALRSPPVQRLPLQVALWLERGPWLTHAGAAQPLGDLASIVLARQGKKLRGMRRRLAGMSDAALHDLRIDVKKMRYAVEFLAPLGHDPAKAKAHAQALADLQDLLGDLQDRATAAQMLATLRHLPADQQDRLAQILAQDTIDRADLIARARHSLGHEKASSGWWL